MSDLLEVGPWAKDKLDRLQRYLAAYTTILHKQKWLSGYVYIDAFAGSGRVKLRNVADDDPTQALFEIGQELSRDRDAREIIDGSPRVALRLKTPFTVYVFVERDRARADRLRQLSDEFKHLDIRVRTGECNAYLKQMLARVNWKKWRAVVFLDPFGMQVPWGTIAALAETRAIEVFLNFPVGMSIQRLLKRNGQFSDKERRRLDNYFGDPSWFDVVYPSSAGLFGQIQLKAVDAEERLVEWYRGRLKSAFGFAPRPHLIRNSHGGHLYFLVFAGPNENGAKIAAYVLNSGSAIRRS